MGTAAATKDLKLGMYVESQADDVSLGGGVTGWARENEWDGKGGHCSLPRVSRKAAGRASGFSDPPHTPHLMASFLSGLGSAAGSVLPSGWRPVVEGTEHGRGKVSRRWHLVEHQPLSPSLAGWEF